MKGDNEIWLNDCFGYFNEVVIPYMKKNVKPDDILVHNGDVFDNRSQIGLHTINMTIELFEEFSKIFKDIRIIVGNHDIWNKHTNDITSINVLKYIPNIKIYYTPQVELLGTKSVLFNPWVEDVNEEKKLLKDVNVDYVFGHLEIGGVTTNSKGTQITNNSTIKNSDFKKSKVYAGHIHIKQDNKNIHYIGSPYHKDRGDRGNERGLTILNVETGKTKFIKNTYSPMFIRDYIKDISDMTVGEIKDRWKNNYVDLYVDSNDISVCNFTELQDYMIGVYKEFTPMSDNTNQTIIESMEIEVDNMKTSDDYIDDYLDQCDLTPKMKQRVVEHMNKLRESL